MILIFGGAYQGKRAFAENELNIDDEKILELDIKTLAPEGVLDEELWINENADSIKDSAIIIQDISQGLVPLSKSERDIREANGRLMIALAREAEEVYRVFCGIGIKIK